MSQDETVSYEGGGSFGRLHKTLGRHDIIFLTLAATISIDTIGQIASLGGAEAFTWTAIIVLTFMLPYGLIMAELGSTFPQEGGPYVWVKLAFGRFWASISTILYWITNPVWLGGSLVFLAATTWRGSRGQRGHSSRATNIGHPAFDYSAARLPTNA